MLLRRRLNCPRVLNVDKPRGMTSYGWRKQQEQRTASAPWSGLRPRRVRAGAAERGSPCSQLFWAKKDGVG
jgi:hypothetical protein